MSPLRTSTGPPHSIRMRGRPSPLPTTTTPCAHPCPLYPSPAHSLQTPPASLRSNPNLLQPAGRCAQAAGWRRSAGPLTHVVVYRAGHMVPHDQPAAALQMMEGWVMAALEGAKFS